MDAQSQFSKEELLDLAYEQLAVVEAQLKAAQKVLRRDWEDLSPRERSERSKGVKELERQQKTLQDEIAMNLPSALG
jgi:hypothetical protein